tara:strand:- start:281 stop:1573 length:1293 start_codon:yes stop_codon:yes gene_type:complete
MNSNLIVILLAIFGAIFYLKNDSNNMLIEHYEDETDHILRQRSKPTSKQTSKVNITFFDNNRENYVVANWGGTVEDGPVTDFLNQMKVELENIPADQKLNTFLGKLKKPAKPMVVEALKNADSNQNAMEVITDTLLDNFYNKWSGNTGTDELIATPLYGKEYNTQTIVDDEGVSKTVDFATGRTLPVCGPLPGANNANYHSNSTIGNIQSVLSTKSVNINGKTLLAPDKIDMTTVTDDDTCKPGTTLQYSTSTAAQLGIEYDADAQMGSLLGDGKTTIADLLGDAAALDDEDMISTNKENEILQDFCRTGITNEECKSSGDYAFCAFDEAKQQCNYDSNYLNTNNVLTDNDRLMIRPPVAAFSAIVNKRQNGNLTESVFRNDIKNVINQCSGILEQSALFRTGQQWTAARNSASKVENKRRNNIRKLVQG